MSVIKGKDVILYFNYNGDEQVVACFQSCTLSTRANLGETSTINTGKWRTFKGVSLEWSGGCAGLVSLDQNLAINQMRQKQFALEPLDIRYVSTDENGLTEIFSSRCLIIDITTNGSWSGVADYSIEIQGVGEISATMPPPVIPEGCDMLWYYYDGIGGEFTTGPIPELVGATLAGYLFRDGRSYRPSGSLHDGSGTPTGTQFSFNPTTGAIGFSTSLPPLHSGEYVDIPYIVCDEDSECESVVIEPKVLPDAIVGQFYQVAINLAGDGPFSLAPGSTKPAWMTLSLDGNILMLVGTPSTQATNIAVQFAITNCGGLHSDTFSDTIDVILTPVTLTFGFVNTESFQSFTVRLNRSIDADVVINRMYAAGYDVPACNNPEIASATFDGGTENRIIAGQINGDRSPETSTPDWPQAIRFTIYNVIVNGTPVSNNDQITIGSYQVTIVLPSCGTL